MHKCKGTSCSGEQCKRKTNDPLGLCFSHKPIAESFSEECAVCLSRFSKGSGVVLGCQHRFHKKCINGLANLSCPCCRREIKYGEIPDKIFRKISGGEKSHFSIIVAIQEEFGLRVYVVSSVEQESNFQDIPTQ